MTLFTQASAVARYIWQAFCHRSLRSVLPAPRLLCPSSLGRQETCYQLSLGGLSPRLCPTGIAEGQQNPQPHSSGLRRAGQWWTAEGPEDAAPKGTVQRGSGQESQGFGDQCKSRSDPRPPHCKSIHKSPSGGGGKERVSVREAEKHKHFCM